MSISVVELNRALAQEVSATNESLTVELADARTLTVPLAWFPRLAHGSPAERANWRLLGGGAGIHWPDLDEDISIKGLLLGHKSGESPCSIQRWLEYRARGEKVPVPTFPLPEDMAEELRQEERQTK